MSLTDFETNHGTYSGFDHGGIFIPGEIGKRIDMQVHPEDYDREGHELTPHHVAKLMVPDVVEPPQSQAALDAEFWLQHPA